MTFETCFTEYLNYLAIKGLAQGTIKWHRLYLKRFLDALSGQGTHDLREVTTGQVQSYLAYLKNDYLTSTGRSLALATYFSHYTAINEFFDWLCATDRILLTPLQGIARPPRSGALRLPEILTEAEAVKILESSPINTPAGLRDRAILEVLYSTGIRRSELIHLNVADFLADRGELVIKLGKGRKDRIVPVGEYAVMFTLAYLKLARSWQAESPKEEALFLKPDGSRISPHTLKSLIARALQKSGVNKSVSPHTFRHSMATHLLRNKADLRHIQAILGHASLQSTEIYTHLTVEDLKQAIKKAHPHGQRKAKETASESD